MTVVPTPPISVGWLSMSLYRDRTDPDPFLGDLGDAVEQLSGRAVELDGWADAMREAWRDVCERPGVAGWVSDYLTCRGDESLTVTFGDTTRIVGRCGDGSFGVSYPAELLLSEPDKVAAMRRALLVVLDRHVERRALDVPLLSVLVGTT